MRALVVMSVLLASIAGSGAQAEERGGASMGAETAERTLSSPGGVTTIRFALSDGVPTYAVGYRGRRVVLPSRLGFTLADAGDAASSFMNATASGFFGSAA